MSTVQKLILIWGGLIALYLFLYYYTGTQTLFSSFGNMSVGLTKALQGRQ
jgi:hypothetical protein